MNTSEQGRLEKNTTEDTKTTFAHFNDKISALLNYGVQPSDAKTQHDIKSKLHDNVIEKGAFNPSLKQTKYNLNELPHIVMAISENITRKQILSGKLSREQMLDRASGRDAHSFVVSELIKSAVELGSNPQRANSGKLVKYVLGENSTNGTDYGIFINNYNGLNTLLNAKSNSIINNGDHPIHSAFRDYSHQNITFKLQAPSKNVDPKNALLLNEYIDLNRKNIQNLIIDKTKEVNISSQLGGNVMHQISTTRAFDKEIFHKLIKRGIDLNKKDLEQNTPLHIAANYGNQKFIYNTQKTKADPNIKNNQGMTPLHIAALANECDCFESLLRLGASPKVLDNRGKPPFYYFDHDKSLLKIKVLRSPEKEKQNKEKVAKYIAQNRRIYPNGTSKADKIDDMYNEDSTYHIEPNSGIRGMSKQKNHSRRLEILL